jgi:hypothetical protein
MIGALSIVMGAAFKPRNTQTCAACHQTHAYEPGLRRGQGSLGRLPDNIVIKRENLVRIAPLVVACPSDRAWTYLQLDIHGCEALAGLKSRDI